MSRRLLHLDPTVYVGWDQPLTTFFVQVYEGEDPDDGPTLWLGTSPARALRPGGPGRLVQAQSVHPVRAHGCPDRDEGR